VTALRELLARLLALGRGRRLDDRLNEEIAAHIELAAADHVARGMSADEARLAALRQFGGVVRVREAHREVRGFAPVDALRQDLRFAIRSCRKSPAFTLVALATLTLAIGANTAIFSLLNALVLRALPVRDPQTLVRLTTLSRGTHRAYLTFPSLQALLREQRVFSAVVAAWGQSVLSVDTGADTTPALVSAVSGNFYGELGIRPIAGRLLTPGDMSLDPPAASTVVVLGPTFWRTHFQADPSAVGRIVRIEGVPFTIVGVAPPGFTGLGLSNEHDLIVPLTATPLLNSRPSASLASSASASYMVLGRLAAGVTLAQARAQLTTAWPAIKRAALPPGYSGARRDDFLEPALDVESGANGFEFGLRRAFQRPLTIVMVIAALILVIACVNLAGLMLSRAAARSHEIAVRLALGAGTWRVTRQMLTEGLLLALAGAGGGVALAYWACAAMTRLIFEESHVVVAFDGTPDARVVALTTAVAVATGVLFSVLPAWRATRAAAPRQLTQGTRTVSRSGAAGRWLVAAQVALSLVLVVNAGLLVRSLGEIRGLETGIDRTDGVVVAYTSAARLGAYASVDNDSYYPAVLARLDRLPGVRRSSIALLKPGQGGAFPDLVAPIGDAPLLERGVEAQRTPMSPGLLDALGVPLVAGRDFDWRDTAGARKVTIVSRSLARRLFGDRDAVGQRLRVGTSPERQDMEIVGVAADARVYDPKNANLFAAYTAALQDPSVNFKCFVVRGEVTYAELKREIEALGVERVGNTATLRYITDRSLLQERLTAMLSSFFAALALLLSAIGLYGLMSYTVAQRRRDIGIRIALGADRARVMRDVVRGGLAITLGGIAVGLGGALGTARLVESLLFGVTPHDPLTLVVAPASLLAVAAIASTLPAARAAHVDPIEALRAE
jgi:putative ABC transport system permease protein